MSEIKRGVVMLLQSGDPEISGAIAEGMLAGRAVQRRLYGETSGGMTEARVEALRRALDADEMPEGSALSNLKRRMEMRYGAGYTLGLACVDGGLTASVTFPRGEEGPGHDVAADR